MTRAPILSPNFRWHSAASHSTSDAFAARQKQRLAEAEARRTHNAAVMPIKRKEQR